MASVLVCYSCCCWDFDNDVPLACRKTEEEETLLPRSARLKTEAPDSYAEPELESPKPKRQPRREVRRPGLSSISSGAPSPGV